MKNNVVRDKSYQFSLDIIRLYQYLMKERKEFLLAKQVIRCGTSIGANIEEAIGSQSKKDFLAKVSIAYKETRETDYWLRLLKDTNYLDQKQFTQYKIKIDGLLRLIGSIKKTTHASLNS